MSEAQSEQIFYQLFVRCAAQTQFSALASHPSPCRRYLEERVFPVLLPGLEALLVEAQKQQCMEKNKTSFNGCDFLTEWLFNSNPLWTAERMPTEFLNIPFVQDWFLKHPRPQVPPQLSEEQAAVLVQAFWRGYRVRVLPDVQELRQWQREWREKNCDIKKTVQEFWAHQENKVWSELVELEQQVESDVSIEVVPPTPQSGVLLTPAPQSSSERRELLTPSSIVSPAMSFLDISDNPMYCRPAE